MKAAVSGRSILGIYSPTGVVRPIVGDGRGLYRFPMAKPFKRFNNSPQVIPRAVIMCGTRRSSKQEHHAYLGISQRTVEYYRAEIMKRTGTKSLAALARLALAAAAAQETAGRPGSPSAAPGSDAAR